MAWWKSIWHQVKLGRAEKQLPPLQLTSRPLNLGMIVGDRLAPPWYRTVFTNLGDVISPETLPPMELQSSPVDVGELIGDQMSRPWWTSLLRNMADKVAPEKMPALALSSPPVDPPKSSEVLFAPRWSDLLTTPKVFYPDKPRPEERFHGFVFQPAPVVPPTAPPDPDRQRVISELTAMKRKELRFAHMREAIWVSCVAAEVAFLILYWVKG
jgi:hypothetical protein